MREEEPGAPGVLFEGAVFAELRARLGRGELSRAIYLDRGLHVAAYRAGDWVIRVPETPASGERIARQTRLYTVLADLGLPVPRDAAIARAADGTVAAGVYRYVAGVPATPARRGAGLARDLGAFLTTLHAVPLEAVREFSDVTTDLWTTRFRRRWERCREHLSAGDRAWLEAVIGRFLGAPDAGGARLVPVHDDLAEEHVLVTPDGRLAGIIDPSGPRIADSALEFGTLADRCGWALADGVLAEYGGPRDAGFARRACFYANVRPLVTIDNGLRLGNEARLRRGLRRLAERRAEGREAW